MGYRIRTLKALALMGAGNRFVTVSTRDLGRDMGVSQQTASYRLGVLSGEGLVHRRRGTGQGQQVMVTEGGMRLLRREYAEYRRIFEPVSVIEIDGRVVSGLGEGEYYLGQRRYREQLTDALGFEPYPGTLNIRMDADNMRRVDMIPRSAFTRIQGFRSGGRSFGQVDCIPATIGEVECAIIMPTRTHHTDVLEVISTHHLRERLGLEDGSALTLTVHLD